MKAPDELTALFRERGLRMTPQRQAVIHILHGNDRHPTAEIVWERVCAVMPTVSQKTVYQVLNDLMELGEVQAVSIDGGATRFDPNVSEHAHFLCRSCGRVYDVVASVPELIASNRETSNRDTGHVVETSEVLFRGRCSSCRATHTTTHKNSATGRGSKEKTQ